MGVNTEDEAFLDTALEGIQTALGVILKGGEKCTVNIPENTITAYKCGTIIRIDIKGR
jgi:hypothetical protein